MKKIIALVIAIVMMAAIAVPAFAAEIVATNTPSDIEVSYTVSGSWTVTVPTELAIGNTKTATADVSAEGVLETNKKLVLSLKAEDAGDFKLTNESDSNYTIAYTVQGTGSALATGTVEALVLSYDAGGSADGDVVFTITGAIPPVVGKYAQTLSFTVAIADVA